MVTLPRKSEIVLSAARALPWLFRPPVTLLLKLRDYRKGNPHWLIMAVKEELGIRISTRMAVDGFLLDTDPFDGPGHTFWRLGLTEPETRTLLARVLKPGMVMLDIGAYVGQFALVASRLNEDIHVFAFEPTPSVFAQLKRNIALNGCNNVVCVNTALSDRRGTAQLYAYPGSADQNSLRPLSGGAERSVTVEVTSIDSFLFENKLHRLDIVKIDVEGNELAVLNGARESLLRFRPLLIIEIGRHQLRYGYTGATIKCALNDLGFECFRIEADGLQPYQASDDELNVSCSHFNILAVAHEQVSGLSPLIA